MSHIIVGLSGGVDSAVAALRLQQQGHQLAAVFMKNWDEDDAADYCPAKQDLADARAIADRLQIELQTVSFSAEYWDRVFAHFLAEYQAGRTPNPDIVCNREIKFSAFLDYATGLGAEFIATGHYARLGNTTPVQLLKGRDIHKDQTYFLHTLTQAQLQHSLFPVGDLPKPEVRRLALRAGFPNYDKKDSTGICFIGERRFSDFLARYLRKNPGEIRSMDNEVIGTHDGLMFYTIGQRQGLGIGGRRKASGEPWYVAGKDMENNILRVVQGVDHPALYRAELRATQLHWISGSPPEMPYTCTARIRHQQPVQACTLFSRGDNECWTRFETPQRAVTPGQSVVFYEGEVCLGGGIIETDRDQAS
ncbi:MAG: tRNA 2-thiouridine(34) synthase MnmA [Gammaproteobacteria bacterium]